MASASTASTVLTERLGRLLLIALNRPHRHNCIDRVTADRLTHVIQNDFEADDTVLGGVLYGHGEDFCVGLDCEELVQSNLACLNKYRLDNVCGPMGPTKMMLSKPLVAAITGRAIGGGLELALACDLRVAESDATLGLHPRKYGLPMMDMGAQRLPHLIGLSRALDLILTGRCLNGSEALQFGLINRLVKPGTAIGIAVDLVNTMCNLSGYAALLADRRAAIESSLSLKSQHSESSVQLDASIQALRSDGIEDDNEARLCASIAHLTLTLLDSLADTNDAICVQYLSVGRLRNLRRSQLESVLPASLVQILPFADDCVLLVYPEEELQRFISAFAVVYSVWPLIKRSILANTLGC